MQCEKNTEIEFRAKMLAPVNFFILKQLRVMKFEKLCP